MLYVVIYVADLITCYFNINLYMYLYLLRHGTTVHNLEKRHQNALSQLSEEGIALIEALTQNLHPLQAQIIFSSPFKRALHTAEIINESLHIPLVINEAIREIKRPTAIEGKFHNEFEVIKIKELIKKNYKHEEWHFSDEENFFDLKKRALIFLHDMEEQKNERVLAISHGIVIKMIAALTIFGTKLDSNTFQHFYDNTSISNGGITICRYQEDSWKLRCLNAKVFNHLT